MPERICYVHCEVDDTDEHHIIPCNYGGPKNGKTVPLCPRCHRLVHRAAERYYKEGRYGPNYDKLPEPHRAKALILIRYILRAKEEHEASGKTIADDARNMVQISCTPDELRLFHAVKEGMGVRNLARAIKILVMKQYMKQNGERNAGDAENFEHLRKPTATNKRGRDKQRKIRNKR